MSTGSYGPQSRDMGAVNQSGASSHPGSHFGESQFGSAMEENFPQSPVGGPGPSRGLQATVAPFDRETVVPNQSVRGSAKASQNKQASFKMPDEQPPARATEAGPTASADPFEVG